VGGAFVGVQAPLDRPVNTGWRVTVHVPLDALFLFDGVNEERLYPV
jgi:hypothetical protein